MEKIKKWVYLLCIAAIAIIVLCAFSNKLLYSNAIRFSEDAQHWIIKYDVTGGEAEYWINKVPKKAEDGKTIQILPMVKYKGVPVTTLPYVQGAAGLVSPSVGILGFDWVGEIEQKDSRKIVIKYSNKLKDSSIKLEFSNEIPLVKIITNLLIKKDSKIYVNYVLWQAIGGKFNLKNRVIAPKGENEYYVINGQAEGIHYFPSNEYWILRMGAEGTQHENVTVGFVTKDSRYQMKLDDNIHKPLTWGPWAMGQDLYLNTKSGFGAYLDAKNRAFDEVPFGLDKITDNIYCVYQEDEAGLNYSWMDYASQIEELKQGEVFHNEVYLWVGEDNWKGDYGLNNDKEYRFMIDKYQDKLK
ncbi:MAG: hypothetical protein N3B21_10725 [Clostridia bacterium]|nr:hypothetical protein [Clostridia bacterium]